MKIFDILICIDGFFKQLEEQINKFRPKIIDDNQKKLIALYEQWGKFGWSVMPPDMSSTHNIFYNDVKSVDEADSLALSIFTEEDLNALFKKLGSIAEIKKDYFDDAVFCYNENKFLPCAMLLYALIDFYFIEQQKDNKSVGKKAIDNAMKYNENNIFGVHIILKNIYTCLIEFFGKTHDFKRSFDIANRNYVLHGVNGKVTKTDCVKLFILLYNTYKTYDKLSTLITGTAYKSIIEFMQNNL